MAFHGISVPFTWIEIGQLSDYWEANQQLMRGMLKGARMPGKERLPRIWTGLNVNVDWDEIRAEGPIYVGSGTRIEPGCEIIGPTWIGQGCHIESGARISRRMLFEYSSIGSQARVAVPPVIGQD